METPDKPLKSPVSQREEEILAFWKEKNIFQKTLEKDSPKGNFVFYDGPPFATGLPHFGHVLPMTMKDVIPRYKTMQGYNVPRRWGWDCHGLPIENLIEKELNLTSKKDIENLGVGVFNKAARDSVLRYADEWKKIVPRLGRWVDMENDYRTMDTSYTESVWWSFKSLVEKNLVYEGFKSMHICPRCETTLSNFEINQGYKDITDISVYAKFELVDEPGTFLVAWTTTPWTLPGNVALAVNPDIAYAKVKIEDSYYIISTLRLTDVLLKGGKSSDVEVVSIKGSDLVGKSYQPIFNYYVNEDLKNKENGWKVYGADFVTTESGTGIVHIAPAFGSDDLILAQKESLPFIQHVGMNGQFTEKVTDFEGQSVKPKDDHQKTDIEIIKWLAHNGKLFAKEKIIHSYPHCWRCDTPLLNYATSSWFVEVTDYKDKLVKENNKVNWIPHTIGEGRFGKWLENARDWNISRTRYWGAPMPVWKCEMCKEKKVIGSLRDLKESLPPRNAYFVMRHGQSESNISDRISSLYSNEDHLTEKGRDQVKKTIQNLKDKKIDLIVGSDFLRTKETLSIVEEELGLNKEQIIFDERLRELNAGIFEGKAWPEFHAYFGSYEERFKKELPQGENYTEVRRRMMSLLYDIDTRFEGKTILIVSHGLPIEMMFNGVLGHSLAQSVAERKEKKFLFDNAEVRELDFVAMPHNELFDIDVHRPYIDDVVFTCACKGEMKRIPEVFDTWYDSGSMPFAQSHYPFENKELLEKNNSPLFPADFIAEGQDQTRGWFYSLLVLNNALFDTSPYKNVIVNGTLLAEDGQKMSKRLKNYPDLLPTLEKYSADALRYFFMASPAVRAEDMLFSEKGVDEVLKKIINRLLNVCVFYETYASQEKLVFKGSKHALDRWMIARLHETQVLMTKGLESYELDRASRPIADFVDDMSTWYVRRSRDRFKGDDEEDRIAALSTTRFVLLEFSKLLAPFMPFLAEDIYIRLRADDDKESVHLENWPEDTMTEEVVEKVKHWFGGGYEGILEAMKEVRRLVSLGLELRASAGIKVRQPLSTLTLKKSDLSVDLLGLIKDEVNVKMVAVDLNLATEIELNAHITPELKSEGDMRELVRAVQDLRKQTGLNPEDKVMLLIDTDETGQQFVKTFEQEIKKTTGLTGIEYAVVEGEKVKAGETLFGLKIQK